MSTDAVRSVPDTTPPENRTLGWAVLAWTAKYLEQPDGPNAGDPWRYTPEQVRIVLRWYALDAHGRFKHRRAVVRRMKGWGKDPFLASIAAVELCGPCRFGGFDADGLPVVVQHPAPWIQVAAVSREQTRNTMTLFPGLFSQKAITDYDVDIGKEVIYARAVGRIEAVTSSPRALEGGRPSLVIANESQHWLTGNGGREMVEAIRRNLGKSRDGSARVVEITNAHLPGEGSVAEESYEAWRAAGGKVPGLYYDALEAPEVDDLTDRQAVRDALLAARGDSTWVPVERLLGEIADPTTADYVSRRFYLNQVVTVGTQSWIPAEAWDACADPMHVIPDNAEVVIGFDGSFDGDSTAVVAVELGETPHLAVVEVWENVEHDPTWRVPIDDVLDTIRDCAKRWRVREVTADPYRWEWPLQALAHERIIVAEFPQRRERTIPATTRMHDAVVDKAMTHDGNADLARHVQNAVLKVTSRGGYITKDAPNSPRKIDLAMASLMALDRASQLEALPPPRRAHMVYAGSPSYDSRREILGV